MTDQPTDQTSAPSKKANFKEYFVFPWDKALITFVTVIWSVEAWKSCTDLLLARQIAHELQLDPKRVQMIKYLMLVSSCIVASMCGMGVALHLAQEKKIKVLKIPENFKYYILLLGLGIYIGWSAVCVAATAYRKSFGGFYLQWMGIAWYVVHPIRFLLIFHQKFPLVFLHSHMLVAFNQSLVLVSTYVTAVSLAASAYITETGFVAAWAALLVVGIAWVLAMYLVKRYRNPASEDLAGIRSYYEQTEGLASFDSKQSPGRKFIFIALLAPGVTLAFMRATVSALLRFMALKAGDPLVTGLQNYHADLIIAMLTMIIVETIVIFVRKYRNDVFELVVIGITQILYIIVLALIVVIIGQVDDILKETPRRGQALVEVYLSEGNSNTAGYIFRNTSVEYGPPFMAKFLKRQIPLTDDDEKMSLRIFNRPFGDVIALSNVSLESRKFQLFQVVHSGNLTKIVEPNKVLAKYTFDPQVYVLNSIHECHEYDEDLANDLGINLTNARGIMFTGGVCAPVEVSFHVMRRHYEGLHYEDLAADIVKEVIRVKPPGFRGISPYIRIPCQYPPTGENSHTCVTVFQGYYMMYEYYHGIGKTFPSPQQQAFKSVSLKPYSINPRRLDYLTKPRQLINILNTINYRNVEEFGLGKMGVPFLFHGIATGIGTVSYIHLIWRQMSISHRILQLYGFFALIFLVESVVPVMEVYRILHKVPVLCAFIFLQVLATAWHLFFSVKLYKKITAGSNV